MCKWAMHSHLTVLRLSSQLSDCTSDSCRCDQLCLEPGLLLSLPAPLPVLGSEVGREGERASEWASSPWPPALYAETMATRLSVTAGDRNRHKHRNRPFCHWDRPAEAWESGGGTVSPSCSIASSAFFSICPNMTKKKSHPLVDCMLLLANGPKGRGSERHRVVGNETGIF